MHANTVKKKIQTQILIINARCMFIVVGKAENTVWRKRQKKKKSWSICDRVISLVIDKFYTVVVRLEIGLFGLLW